MISYQSLESTGMNKLEGGNDSTTLSVTDVLPEVVCKLRLVTLGQSISNNKIAESSGSIVQLSAPKEELVYPSHKGLVDIAATAYNQHHDLVWRPDDVWQAILTQFSLYVMKNAEALRDKFVDFQGKRELTILTDGTLYTVDFGDLAKRMVDEQIIKNIKDPTIAEWILPKFTTTTNNDRIVASVTMMATLKEYFHYGFCCRCGLPSVTLLGTVDDWKLLHQRVDRLLEFDNQGGDMKKWHRLLTGVLDEFIKTKSGVANIEFWQKIYDFSRGSGKKSISGWISVFAVFNEHGKWQGDKRRLNHVDSDWPVIETEMVPPGAVLVPVHIDDNGMEYEGCMMAGQFAFDGEGTSVRPRSDWCIAVKGPPKAPTVKA